MNNWSIKFRDILFSVNKEYSKNPYAIQKFISRQDLLPSEKEIDLAYKMKYENIPKSLFKYRGFDDQGFYLDNIENNRLWLSKPIDFNDPFDARIFSQTDDFFEKSEAHLENLKKEKLFTQKNIEQYELVISAMKEKKNLLTLRNELNAHIHRVGCLSEVNDSILMWSHYSSNHSGFCIEYAMNELKENDECSIALFPVFYMDIEKNQREDILNGIKFYKLFAVLRKSKEWAYEKEWRIVIPTYDKIENIVMPRIKGIYLGCNISQKNKDKILSLSKVKNFDVYQTYKKSGQPQLYFTKEI
jgi:hypothetical protein